MPIKVTLFFPSNNYSHFENMNAPQKINCPQYHLGGPRTLFRCSSYCKHAPPTVNVAPPTVNSAHPTINSAPYTVNTAPPTVNSAPPTVYSAPPTVNSAPPTVYMGPPTVNSSSPTVKTAPPTVYWAPPNTVNAAPPTIYTAPSTVNWAPFVNVHSRRSLFLEFYPLIRYILVLFFIILHYQYKYCVKPVFFFISWAYTIHKSYVLLLLL